MLANTCNSSALEMYDDFTSFDIPLSFPLTSSTLIFCSDSRDVAHTHGANFFFLSSSTAPAPATDVQPTGCNSSSN